MVPKESSNDHIAKHFRKSASGNSRWHPIEDVHETVWSTLKDKLISHILDISKYLIMKTIVILLKPFMKFVEENGPARSTFSATHQGQS